MAAIYLGDFSLTWCNILSSARRMQHKMIAELQFSWLHWEKNGLIRSTTFSSASFCQRNESITNWGSRIILKCVQAKLSIGMLLIGKFLIEDQSKAGTYYCYDNFGETLWHRVTLYKLCAFPVSHILIPRESHPYPRWFTFPFPVNHIPIPGESHHVPILGEDVHSQWRWECQCK